MLSRVASVSLQLGYSRWENILTGCLSQQGRKATPTLASVDEGSWHTQAEDVATKFQATSLSSDWEGKPNGFSIHQGINFLEAFHFFKGLTSFLISTYITENKSGCLKEQRVLSDKCLMICTRLHKCYHLFWKFRKIPEISLNNWRSWWHFIP